jgi:biopolymer transport protein ExbB
MNAKILTIASAIVLVMGLGLGQAYAQAPTDPAAPAADPTAVDPTAVDPTAVPTDPTLAAPEAAPADTGAAAVEEPTTEDVENPYGLQHMWEEGDFVSKFVLIMLVIMSIGTWYIFFTKYLEQARAMNNAKVAEKRFWTASSLEDGAEKLGKNNIFRNIVERGQQAMARQAGVSGGLSQADWVQMSLARAVEEENARLGTGVAFLASVGSTSPFVGLFGTVWGILQALTAIGIAGQMSIDKVAGPVGEALIMTAIGLAVAVPAVLCYNLLVRRNKVLNEKFRSFAADLQTYLLTSKR